MKKLPLIFLSLCCWACADEEALPGTFITEQIEEADLYSAGGVDYQRQLYFDLSSNQLKAQNRRDAWDIALSAQKGKPNLFVNPAMLVSVAGTGSRDFSQRFDPNDYKFEYERADVFYERGQIMKRWQNPAQASEVFLINRGRNFENQERGYQKLQCLAYENGQYRLRLADLDNSNQKELTLTLDDRFNYQFVNLDHPDSLLSLEPPKAEWDLLFSRYMERLFDGSDTLDYSVTGVLTNPYGTAAYAVDSSLSDSLPFSRLSLAEVEPDRFQQGPAAIGHDWKRFDLDAGVFTVDPKRYFFVRDAGEQIYRLRFTGFYSDEGRKGAVRFEYLPL